MMQTNIRKVWSQSGEEIQHLKNGFTCNSSPLPNPEHFLKMIQKVAVKDPKRFLAGEYKNVQASQEFQTINL